MKPALEELKEYAKKDSANGLYLSSLIKRIESEAEGMLLHSYRVGWSDCIAGDDVRSLDYQSDEQILESIKNIEVKS